MPGTDGIRFIFAGLGAFAFGASGSSGRPSTFRREQCKLSVRCLMHFDKA